MDNNKRVPSFSSECPASRVKDRLSGVYVYIERTIKEVDRSVGRTKFYSRNTSKYVICYDEDEEEEEEQLQQQQENVKHILSASRLLIYSHMHDKIQ